MASEKNLKLKKDQVSEINAKLDKSNTVLLVDYQGMTVSELNGLRKSLKDNGSDLKVYKNTLAKRAMDMLNLDMADHLEGPTAISFSSDALAPVKVLAEFAKKHEALELKVGIVDGKISDVTVLNQLATIPSRDTLLTMLAAGMLGTVKDLSICLDLYSKDLEEKVEEIEESGEKQLSLGDIDKKIISLDDYLDKFKID